MKRFLFPLARFERLRLARRREALAVLAARLRRVDDARRRREDLESALDAADGPPANGRTEDARTLKDRYAHREGLRGAARTTAIVEAAARESAATADRAHTEAMRAHRAIEKLHTRRHQAWRVSAAKEDQKFLDEMHLLRVARGEGSTEGRP
jgi:hypothetical protein